MMITRKADLRSFSESRRRDSGQTNKKGRESASGIGPALVRTRDLDHNHDYLALDALFVLLRCSFNPHEELDCLAYCPFPLLWYHPKPRFVKSKLSRLVLNTLGPPGTTNTRTCDARIRSRYGSQHLPHAHVANVRA
jgi:hypothetical protein